MGRPRHLLKKIRRPCRPLRHLIRLGLSVLSLGVFACARTGSEPLRLSEDLTWTQSFAAPFTDQRGQRLTGTEIIDLVNHRGQIFAGNSYWNETREIRRGQIFILSNANSQWQLDFQMPPRYSRVAALQSVTFRTDGHGRPVEPQTILLAGATYDKGKNRPGPGGIFIRDDERRQWIPKTLGETDHAFAYTQIRSFGFYRDKVTGVDQVFVGGNPAPLGAYTGVYDPSQPGRIRWRQQPEFTPPGYQRILGFAEVNGRFYAATQKRIYQRIDGPQPRWEVVRDFADRDFIQTHALPLDPYWIKEDDIRGFRSLPNPQGEGEVLIFGLYNKIFRLDPRNRQLTVELDIRAFLDAALKREVHYIQTQNHVDIPLQGQPPTSYIGIEIFYPPNYLKRHPEIPEMGGFAREGFFLKRRQQGSQVTYQLQQITTPTLDLQNHPLARVRAFLPSPFPEERGRVIYAGGFAPWFVKVSNTAWIYKGTLPWAAPKSLDVSDSPLVAQRPGGIPTGNALQYSNLSYGEDRNHTLDIYVPRQQGQKRPVLIYIHGGGWKEGDKAHTGVKDEMFTALDFVFVSLNYRLSPPCPPCRRDPNRVMFPTHVEDVARAIAHVYKIINTYGGDPDQIYLLGHSAGAHLASLVATDGRYLQNYGLPLSILKGVASLDAGGYDIPAFLERIGRRNRTYEIYANAFSDDPKLWKAASPVTYISPRQGIPPFLLVYQDLRVKREVAQIMGDRLEDHGIPVTLYEAKGLSHLEINRTLGQPGTPLTEEVGRFFLDLVKRGQGKG